ncbi:MAG TPA: hydroxymethylbilane synthase [Candidatus Didemnitutus sp.]|nr:hydroxymethylbilane synthase [Candidatus Didemnitutus sp.]
MKLLRIGTRGSALARRQADAVSTALSGAFNTTTVIIESQGDLDLSTPLWHFDGVGVFSAALDRALLEKQIDIAVHSMKDVPTTMPEGLCIMAVLPRGSVHDTIIMASPTLLLEAMQQRLTIGTSSRRRSAQWLHRYPHHTTVPLRGNIATRLSYLERGTMDGIIMAEAALQRLNLTPQTMKRIDWMIPAPSQGAICIVGRISDQNIADALLILNDPVTALATTLERTFLAALDGGCSSAIGAIATVDKLTVSMKCTIHNADGSKAVEVSGTAARTSAHTLVADLVQQALRSGARALVSVARNV